MTQPKARQPYRIPGSERYVLDADGFCWREVEIHGEVMHSMARVNPDNTPTPRPLLYLTPVTEEHHTLRAYRLALMDAAAIFRQTADRYEPNTIGRHGHDVAARVLRKWAEDPGRMIGPLHRLRADEMQHSASCPACGEAFTSTVPFRVVEHIRNEFGPAQHDFAYPDGPPAANDGSHAHG